MNTRHFIRQTPYLAWVMLYCAVTAGLFGVMLGLVTPNLRAQWQLSYQDMGLLMTLSSAGGVVGSLLGGHIAKRFDTRRLFLAYACFTLTMLVGLANAPTFGVLVVCFALTAVTESALFTLGHGVLANMSNDSETRTRFIGLVDVGFSLGTLVAPLWVAGWFAVNPAWRGPYLAFVGFVALLVALLWPHRAYTGLALNSPAAGSTVDTTADTTAPAPATDRGYLALATHPVVLPGLAAALLVGYVEWGQNYWLVSYVEQGLEWGATLARQAVFALMLGMLVGRVWQTFVASRWSMETKIGRLAWLCVGALLVQNAAGWLAHTQPAWAGPMQALFVLASLGVGLGVSVGFPILLGSLIHALPQEASRLSALMMIAISAGAALASQSVGRLADAWGMATAFGLLVASAVAYVAALAVMHRRLAAHDAQAAVTAP
ncbi:MAG: MFS transporter [Burkholderiaceae bacterium]